MADWTTNKDLIQKLYIAFYGRPADPGGLRHWAQQLPENAKLTDDATKSLIETFVRSDEAKARIGNVDDATMHDSIVDKIYTQAFHRDATAAEKAQFASTSISDVLVQVLGVSSGPDYASLNNKLDYANWFAETLDPNGNGLPDDDSTGTKFMATFVGNTDATDIAAKMLPVDIDTIATKTAVVADVKAIAEPDDPISKGEGEAQNFTLTVNQDTASASTFEAPIFTSTMTGAQIQTLTTVDKLTGTSSADVLNAVLNATEASTKPTLSNIEKVNLTTIAASVFDAANSTGVTQIGSVDSSADLTVRNLAAGASVEVKNSAAGVDSQFQFVNSAASGASDAVSIKLDGVGRGATAGNTQILNVRGETAGSFETLNIESTGGASRFANIGSDATVAVATAPTAAGSQVKTVNVTGNANLRVDGALLNVTTVDANAFEGNLRVILDATQNVTVTGGKGADYFNFAGGLSNLDTVNGNDGRDTIAVTANTGLGDGNKVTNVEILRNDGAAGGTIFDLSKVASFDAVVHNTANTATYNNLVKAGAADAEKGLTQLSTGAITVGVKDANALGSNSDTLQIKVGEATQAATFVAGAVTTSAVEKIVVDVKDAGGNTATAAGAFLSADAALGTVEFKGGSLGTAFNAGPVAGSGVSLTSIDGSAFVGDLTVAGNAFSQVIKGGSGNDTLATGGRAAFALGTVADTLTGNGGGDTFSFADATDGVLTGANVTLIDAPAAVTATNRGEIVTITDLNLGGANAGTQVDTIDFSGAVLGAVAPGGFAIVNGGAATALTGVDLGAALNALVQTGNLGAAGVGVEAAGLFTWAGDTYLVATTNTAVNDTFGNVAGQDIIIKVTGVSGTLDVTDFV